MTWRGRHMATRHSAKAAGRWTATASGSPATGPATWQDANTTSGRPPRPPHRLNVRSPSLARLTCLWLHSALYVVDLKKFRKIAAGDRLRGQYQGLSQDPNSLSNLDQVCLRVVRPHFTAAPVKHKKLLFCFQDLPNNMIHQVPIKSLPQEWLWCETWCDDRSKKSAKTIDLVRTGPPPGVGGRDVAALSSAFTQLLFPVQQPHDQGAQAAGGREDRGRVERLRPGDQTAAEPSAGEQQPHRDGPKHRYGPDGAGR